MKLNAHKFANGLWISAAILVSAQWGAYFLIFDPTGVHIRELVIQNVMISVMNSVVYAGGLVGLGAAVRLLGEIRDRLPERP